MLDFNLYYAEKVAEARQHEVERRSRPRRSHGPQAAVEAMPEGTGPALADCREAGMLHRRRPRTAT